MDGLEGLRSVLETRSEARVRIEADDGHDRRGDLVGNRRTGQRRVKSEARVSSVRGDFEGVKADIESAFERGGVTGHSQGGGRGALGAEAEFGKMSDDFGDVGRVRAKALIELFWSQELMELGVPRCVGSGEEFFRFIAVAHPKSDSDGQR